MNFHFDLHFVNLQLRNKFDFRNVYGIMNTSISVSCKVSEAQRILHGQVSLEAVNQINVFLDAMNGCKKTEDSLKACFENVNI